MPTWLSGKSIAIIKTQNGWAIGPDAKTPIEQCVVFETWDALVAYMSANFAGQAQG